MPFRNSIPLNDIAPGLVGILGRISGVSITEGDVGLDDENPLRVYTWVAKWKRHGESHLALLLSPGGKRRNNKSITDIFGVRNQNIRSAEDDYLSKIGMRSNHCHPFPDWGFVIGGTITHLVMDNQLYGISDRAYFPIYGATGRVATAQLSPQSYYDSVKILTAEGIGKVMITPFTINQS
ncbi:hypothetical protein HYU13_05465 [Candidatus Woesearchaeota archaeon]|nr:hypothetical protein [Candidatus Woesearchaeota archaeon]